MENSNLYNKLKPYYVFIDSSTSTETSNSINNTSHAITTSYKNNNNVTYDIGKQINNVVQIKIKDICLRQSWPVLRNNQRVFMFKKINNQTNNSSIHTINIPDNICTVEFSDFINLFNTIDVPQMKYETNKTIKWYSNNNNFNFVIMDTPLSKLLGVRDFDTQINVFDQQSAILLNNSVPHQYIRPDLYLSLDLAVDSNLNGKSLNVCYKVSSESTKQFYNDKSEHLLITLKQPIRRLNCFKVLWYYFDGSEANLYYTNYSLQIIFYNKLDKIV